MSESLTFDLIVKDDSARGLNKFADNLEKAGKKATESGRHVASGLDDAGDSADKADGKLGKLGKTLDMIKGKFGEAKAKGVSPLLDSLVALGPALVPIATAGIPAVVGLGAAFAGAGAAGLLFKGVMSQTFSEVQDDAKKLDKVQDQIKELGDQAKIAGASGDAAGQKSLLAAQAKAVQKYQAALKGMDPDQKKAVQGYRMMTGVWQQFLDKNKPASFGILTQGYDLIQKGIGAAQPLFDAAANAASGFLNRLQDWADSGGLKGLVDFLAGQATQTFSKVEIILRNLVRGFGPLFRLTAGQGQGFLSWITKASASFARFGQGGGWERFLAYTSDNAPAVQMILKNLVSIVPTLVTSFQQLSPLAGVSIALAGALSQIIAAIPPEALTAIVAGFIVYSTVLKLHTAYAIAASVATKAWTAGQWLLNAALTANPIGLVVVAVVGLIAAIVLIATKTKFFQTVWSKTWSAAVTIATGAWKVIKAIGLAVMNGYVSYVKMWLGVYRFVFNTARSVAITTWNRILSVGKAVVGALVSSWRSSINRIKDLIQGLRTKAGEVLGTIRSLFSADALFGAGQRLISGLARGVASKMGDVVDSVKSGLGKIKGMLPGSPIQHGPLVGWNNGKAGERLMGLLTTGVQAGSKDFHRAMSSAVGVRTPVVRAVSTGTITSDMQAYGSSAGSYVGGSSAGTSSSSAVTVNFYGTQFGSPEQIARSVVGAVRQAKANGYVVPAGTFQGGSV